MSGFGHRVYKNYDPRAKVIRKLAEEVFTIVGRDPLIEVSFLFPLSLGFYSYWRRYPCDLNKNVCFLANPPSMVKKLCLC